MVRGDSFEIDQEGAAGCEAGQLDITNCDIKIGTDYRKAGYDRQHHPQPLLKLQTATSRAQSSRRAGMLHDVTRQVGNLPHATPPCGLWTNAAPVLRWRQVASSATPPFYANLCYRLRPASSLIGRRPQLLPLAVGNRA